MEKERGRTGALALVTRSLHGPSWSHADSFSSFSLPFPWCSARVCRWLPTHPGSAWFRWSVSPAIPPCPGEGRERPACKTGACPAPVRDCTVALGISHPRVRQAPGLCPWRRLHKAPSLLRGRGSPPGAGSSPWGGVGSRVRVPATASRRPASGLSASPGGRGEEGRSLGSRSARLPAPRSPHGRLRCRQQVALRSVPFCRRGPRFAPSIFWNWPATAAIHFLKPGQRVELQPNSICRYQEQRRKENRELLRRQGANRRVKCPACPHTAELKRDPSSARPHPRQDASGQHSVLCASVVERGALVGV